ncbi:LTA synthase family protein [Campylobacter insulaenigrae]|uniref:Phosphoglycerol transferase n=1 Tax=Campylobacter insulaenigrae NCTC 12927 TaxID=1031564 RepID=A0A0A8H1W9_9BACT|nr:phosphoglycerol transferase [Campylobacter insulaenigrae]AJC88081.1 phosphoglycerol transferase [Campylobacter insulaenigrae NCTC 12927]VEH94774.1 integral membrane protein [Campylobacter insulaenigrae]
MRKVLLQISIFSVLFSIVFALNRFLMQVDFIPENLSTSSEIVMMYSLGLFHDIRFLSAIFLPLLLCGFFTLFFCNIKNQKLTMQGKKFYFIFSNIYVIFVAVLSIGFSYAKYYYYEIYKSKFDIFLFSVKDENTQAIYDIIISDYPLIKITLIMIVFCAFCVFINTRILNLKLKPIKFKMPTLIFLNIVLVCVYIVALRGPFKHVAINVQNYSFSEFKVINDVMLNPVMAFSWAYKQYKEEEKMNFITHTQAENLQNELFMYWSKSPHNEYAKNFRPSIFINFMESFGWNLADFKDEEHNYLGALDRHFKQDFVFQKFLSSTNGTIPSFANLFFLSPFANISTSKFQKTYLKYTPIELYKQQGYKIIFVSAGNGAWQNIRSYLSVLGVDEIIDENILIREFNGAKESENGYGVADEFLYKKVYDLLEKNPHNTLIISLTISNHPPYKISHFDENILKNTHKGLLDLLPYNEEKQNNIIKAYTYANDEFGKFLDKIKQSSFKDSVIIAATGDHRVREMSMDAKTQKAFAYSVPFYLYVPKNLQKDIYYDKNRIGSHKDIFPTLYALSLDNVDYLSLGGKSMLRTPSDKKLEFGFNDVVWVDENGVYPVNSFKGYRFEKNTSLKDTNEAFDLDSYHKDFAKKYQELNFYFLGIRLGLIE